MSLKRVKPVSDGHDIDSVKSSMMDEGKRAFNVLMEAQHYWNMMDDFRKARQR